MANFSRENSREQARERREKEANDACGKDGAPPPNDRVVAAIAEANGGDVEAATKLATNTYAERVKGCTASTRKAAGAARATAASTTGIGATRQRPIQV